MVSSSNRSVFAVTASSIVHKISSLSTVCPVLTKLRTVWSNVKTMSRISVTEVVINFATRSEMIEESSRVSAHSRIAVRTITPVFIETCLGFRVDGWKYRVL
ncbi:hypothetical protein D3C72_1949690 [compost metagenome]